MLVADDFKTVSPQVVDELVGGVPLFRQVVDFEDDGLDASQRLRIGVEEDGKFGSFAVQLEQVDTG